MLLLLIVDGIPGQLKDWQGFGPIDSIVWGVGFSFFDSGAGLVTRLGM
jgi:hypothetical protein